MSSEKRKRARERMLIRRGRAVSRIEADLSATNQKMLEMSAKRAEQDIQLNELGQKADRLRHANELAQVEMNRKDEIIAGLRQLLKERDSAMETTVHELSQLKKEHKKLLKEDRDASRLRKANAKLKALVNQTRAERDRPCFHCGRHQPALPVNAPAPEPA